MKLWKVYIGENVIIKYSQVPLPRASKRNVDTSHRNSLVAYKCITRGEGSG